MPQQTLSDQDARLLLQLLEKRFLAHMHRHANMKWQTVLERLNANAPVLWSLQQMEATGGEPDVVGIDESGDTMLFADWAAESPAGRRSLCYDEDALHARKENKPAGSALGMAAAMGIELMDEVQYHALQQLEAFDTKTSSWLMTPAPIRQLGGAIFGDCRYQRVFVYHNGAQSYYAARGFRGVLRV